MVKSRFRGYKVGKMQDIDHVEIEKLNLSKRTFHALARSGILTIGDLRQFNKNKYQIRNIGNKSFDEIAKALESLNINLPLSVLLEKDTVQAPVYDEEVIKTASQLSIDALSLPRVIKGALKKNGIKTVKDFLNVPDSNLSNFNRVGPKALATIELCREDFVKNHTAFIVTCPKLVVTEKKTVTWGQIAEEYFRSEKDIYSYILISRFGFSPKTLEEIAIELGVTRERVRQIQEAVAVRYLNHIRFSGAIRLLEKVEEVFSVHGDSLSLSSLKAILKRDGALGQFSEPVKTERIRNLDLLETMICWLNLISNKKYTIQPIEFSVDISDLTKSGKISIRDHATLMNISKTERRKIKRKVLFTGGITVREASKILSKDEKIAVLVLKNLNLQKTDDEWFTFKSFTDDQDNSKIPLRIAGLKMLAVNPIMNIDSFHDGLRRHASRFYSGVAPIHVIEHILPILGFDLKNYEVSTQLSTKGILSKSEQCLTSAIKKNGGVASFLEIAEEFFLHSLSLPAVSVTLKRSPIAEKTNEGFHKLRGIDISWQQIEDAQKRQKRFAQDEEVSHGLDGVVRLKFTVNSYAFLTGVVGAYSVKEMVGSWSLVYKDKLYGEVKIDESYLWSLAKLFKELGVKMGDRMELGFNTWNRCVSIERIENGPS